MRKLYQEVEEFDKNELQKIERVDQLQDLLAQQLTNQSFISKSESVFKLYHLIRLFTLNKVMDCRNINEDDNSSDDAVDQMVRNNIDDLLTSFNFIDTTDLSPEDAVVLSFLLIYSLGKLGMSSKPETLENVTIMIQSREMQILFSELEIRSLLSKIMHKSMFSGIRIIFLSDDEHSDLDNLSTLDLSPKMG